MQQLLYEFGPFSINTQERLLLRKGQRVALKPKVYETLIVLIRNNGRVVDKEELMKQVWPDTFVEENNLTGNIFALRRAFGEHQYIETVPRRGYRFTADVKQVRVEDVKLPDMLGVETELVIKETVGIAGQVISSLAVLPFLNAGADPEMDYLSEGITESIIDNLAQLSQLRVMGRSTVFRYAGRQDEPQTVGRELNVRAVLMGRVVKLHDRLSVRAELIDVADGAQLWGKQYSHNTSDIPGLQEEISSEISAELRIKLTGEERERLRKRHTKTPEAFHSYLRGRYYVNKRTSEGLKKALDHFRQAIEFDSAYALAYSGLADCYTLLGSAGYDAMDPREVMPKARTAALKALEIDDALAEAHTSLAFIKFRFDWDWFGAKEAFERALTLKPGSATAHHWYALYLTVMEHHTEAIREIKEAQNLDPLSLIIASAAGRVYHFARQYDQALEEYRKTLDMDPSYGEAHFNLGLTYEQQRMYSEAIAELREAISLSGSRPVMLAMLGHVYSMAGNHDEARSVLDQFKDLSNQSYVSPLEVAILYVGLGEKDQAFGWLEKAYQERAGPLVYLKVEPLYDSLRSEPRFDDLLIRMNLGTRPIVRETWVSIPRVQETSGAHGRLSASRSERQRSIQRISLVALLIAFTALAVAAAVLFYRRGAQVEGTTSKFSPVRSIAVLPFKPLGEGSGDEFLSLGMADALITRLSSLKQLVVRPTSSILRYTAPDQDPLEAGRQQIVDAVLDGKIQRAGERVRVTVQLIRVQDGRQLWAEKFDEKFTDIFALQDAISERVAGALTLELTGAEQKRLTRRYTENAEAYQLYLKGRYFWNKRTQESLKKGIEYFTQAIEKDSRYALAHAGLADSYIILGNFGLLPPTEAYPKAKAAAEEALKVDADLVEAQVSSSFVKSLFERDWPGAEAGFRRAVELNPNYGPAHQWYGVSLAGAGRVEEAVAELKRAQEVDPLSLTINAVVGWMLYLAGDYDEAIAQEKIVLEMDPNFVLAHRYLGLAYEQKGMYAEAISEFQKAVNLSGARPLDVGALGHAYAVAGRTAEARQVLNEARTQSARAYFPAHEIALVHVGLGEKDHAFEWFDKAFKERSPWLIHLQVDPRFDPLHSDPRFTELVHRVRFAI